jgi:GT2 family glycosyltransferase
MIIYPSPYSTEKNIGKHYNQVMSILPNSSDWACFIDGDAMFTTIDFGHQIEAVIKNNPDCGLFTAMTNRVGTKYQCVKGMWDENDMRKHRMKGEELKKQHNTKCIDITDLSPISGVVILLKKQIWEKVAGFEENNMLGIDNSIHYRVANRGLKVKLMLGVYVYHWYRGGNRSYNKHLL